MWNSKEITRDKLWTPFRVDPVKTDVIRALTAAEGVADRLRLVAFAELQARDAFAYGAAKFKEEVPADWIRAWEEFAKVEDRHAQMLLTRMYELGVDPGARLVSEKLTRLCLAAKDAVTFLFILASAEERGMEAGEILGAQMVAVDEVSAAIFAQIAKEEVEHVAMSKEALASYSYEELRERARQVNQWIQ